MCNNDYKIKNYDLLRKLKKFIKRNREKIKISKNRKNKQKTYNVEVFSMSSDSFIDINFDNKKDMKRIVILFKELINKIFKLNWIADIDVSFYMTDQLRFFNKSFTSIKRRTIKIEERILHSDQYETMIMKIKNDECRLINVLYVSNLKINLLFERRFTKKDL